MIPRIFPARRDCAGSIHYALAPDHKPELLAGISAGRDAAALVREFNALRELRPDVKDPFVHLSLSFAPDDRLLSRDEMGEMVKKYLDRMGYEGCQYMAVEHRDKNHQHVHIIVNRVRPTGELKWKDRGDFQKAMAVAAQLEKEYGLRQVDRSRQHGARELTREELEVAAKTGQNLSERMILQQIVLPIAQARLTLPQFVDELQKQGIAVRFHLEESGRVVGVSYKLGQFPFSGRALGQSYTFPGLQREGVRYDAKRDLGVVRELAVPLTRAQPPERAAEPAMSFERADQLRVVLRSALEGGPTLETFLSRVEAAGAKVEFNLARTGHVSGVRFVYEGETIRGSQLGREFSLQGMQTRGLRIDAQTDAARIETRAARAGDPGVGEVKAKEPARGTGRGGGVRARGPRSRGAARTDPDDPKEITPQELAALRALVVGAMTDRPTLTAFVQRLEAIGVDVRFYVDEKKEHVLALGYEWKEQYVPARTLGESVRWNRLSVDYDRTRDQAAVTARAKAVKGSERADLSKAIQALQKEIEKAQQGEPTLTSFATALARADIEPRFYLKGGEIVGADYRVGGTWVSAQGTAAGGGALTEAGGRDARDVGKTTLKAGDVGADFLAGGTWISGRELDPAARWRALADAGVRHDRDMDKAILERLGEHLPDKRVLDSHKLEVLRQQILAATSDRPTLTAFVHELESHRIAAKFYTTAAGDVVAIGYMFEGVRVSARDLGEAFKWQALDLRVQREDADTVKRLGEQLPHGERFAPVELDFIRRNVLEAASGAPDLTTFVSRLEEQRIGIRFVTSPKGYVLAVSYRLDEVWMNGRDIEGARWSQLRVAGVRIDGPADRETLARHGAVSVPTRQLPAEEIERLRTTVAQASQEQPSLAEFVRRVEKAQVSVHLRARAGELIGIAYSVDGTRISDRAVGGAAEWSAIQGAGVRTAVVLDDNEQKFLAARTEEMPPRRPLTAEELRYIRQTIQDGMAARPTLTDFLERLERDGVTASLHIDKAEQIVAIGYKFDGETIAARDLGEMFRWSRLDIRYDSRRDAEAVLAHRFALPDVPREPNPALVRAVEAALTDAVRDSPNLTTFVERLQLAGVTPRLLLSDTGRLTGVDYRTSDGWVSGRELGEGLRWRALLEADALRPDRLKDEAVIERLGDRAPGRRLPDENALENVRRLIADATGDRPGVAQFIERLQMVGVPVRFYVDGAGEVLAVQYTVNGTSLGAKELGDAYKWQALDVRVRGAEDTAAIAALAQQLPETPRFTAAELAYVQRALIAAAGEEPNLTTFVQRLDVAEVGVRFVVNDEGRVTAASYRVDDTWIPGRDIEGGRWPQLQALGVHQAGENDKAILEQLGVHEAARRVLAPDELAELQAVVRDARAGSPGLADFVTRLEAHDVQIRFHTQEDGAVGAIAYTVGGVRVSGRDAGEGCSWDELQRAGVHYRRGVDDGVLNERSEPLPPPRVMQPEELLHVRRSIAQAALGRPDLTAFVERLRERGVDVRLYLDPAKNVFAVGYGFDRAWVASQDLGDSYRWQQLERAGVQYDVERDKAVVERVGQVLQPNTPAWTHVLHAADRVLYGVNLVRQQFQLLEAAAADPAGLAMHLAARAAIGVVREGTATLLEQTAWYITERARQQDANALLREGEAVGNRPDHRQEPLAVRGEVTPDTLNNRHERSPSPTHEPPGTLEDRAARSEQRQTEAAGRAEAEGRPDPGREANASRAAIASEDKPIRVDTPPQTPQETRTAVTGRPSTIEDLQHHDRRTERTEREGTRPPGDGESRPAEQRSGNEHRAERDQPIAPGRAASDTREDPRGDAREPPRSESGQPSREAGHGDRNASQEVRERSGDADRRAADAPRDTRVDTIGSTTEKGRSDDDRGGDNKDRSVERPGSASDQRVPSAGGANGHEQPPHRETNERSPHRPEEGGVAARADGHEDRSRGAAGRQGERDDRGLDRGREAPAAERSGEDPRGLPRTAEAPTSPIGDRTADAGGRDASSVQRGALAGERDRAGEQPNLGTQLPRAQGAAVEGATPKPAELAAARPATASENRTVFLESLSRLRRQNEQLGGARPRLADPAAHALKAVARAVRTARPDTIKTAMERPEKAVLEGAKTAVRAVALIKPAAGLVTKPVEKVADAVKKNIDRSDGGRDR